MGVLLSDLKRNDEAEAAYRKAIELNPALTEAYYNLACLKSILGNASSALEYLEKALANGFDRVWAKQDPDLENLHNDPRFKELVGE